MFQSKMSGLSAEIQVSKEERQVEFEKNSEIRQKISTTIDEYKVKEDNFKSKMEEFNVRITSVQAELKEEMVTGKLGKTVARCDKEKKNYDQAMGKIKKLSEDIQEFVKKFD